VSWQPKAEPNPSRADDKATGAASEQPEEEQLYSHHGTSKEHKHIIVLRKSVVNPTTA
jgi:hypothetical protein